MPVHCDIMRYYDEFGCTLMCHGWATQNKRNTNNFLVYCPISTVCLKFVDAIDGIKSQTYIFKLMNSVVKKIGVSRVVYIVTDNGANFKVGGQLFIKTRLRLFWTSYVAHCINPILDDITKEPKVRYHHTCPDIDMIHMQS